MGNVGVEMLCSFEAFTSCHWLNPLPNFSHARDDVIGYGSELTLSGCSVNLFDRPHDPSSPPFLMLEPRGWCPELSPSHSNQWCHHSLPATLPMSPTWPPLCPYVFILVSFCLGCVLCVQNSIDVCQVKGRREGGLCGEWLRTRTLEPEGPGLAACLLIILRVILLSGATVFPLGKWGSPYMFRELWED